MRDLTLESISAWERSKDRRARLSARRAASSRAGADGREGQSRVAAKAAEHAGQNRSVEDREDTACTPEEEHDVARLRQVRSQRRFRTTRMGCP